MISTHTTFREVSLTGRKRFTCACGRRLSRQKKFYQTLNPFNKNSKGEIKTVSQIYDELAVQKVAWKAEIDRCTHAALNPCGASFELPSEDLNLDSVKCDLPAGHSGLHYAAPKDQRRSS